MSGPIRVTMLRTLGNARNHYSTAVAFGLFLAATAAYFAYNLSGAEGARIALATVWASSIAPIAPVLAAFLAMDVWSDELKTGRVDFLLTAAVREREYVIGKFLGVWLMMLFAFALSLVFSMAITANLAPSAFSGFRIASCLPAFVALALQSVLWVSVSLATSSMTAFAPAAFVGSALLTIALPRCGWAAAMALSEKGHAAFGEMPFDADVYDIASGIMSTNSLAFYIVMSLAAMFVTSKAIMRLRCIGRGGRAKRMSGVVACTLALVAAGLATRIAWRYDVTLDLPVSNVATAFSQRTRSVLADSSGEISATLFLARNDGAFRRVSHILRMMKRESAALGGARFDLWFVDPSWDVGEAERLVRDGVVEKSVTLRRGGRRVSVAVGDDFGEHDLASAIRRLTTSPQRRNVCWTHGHGEASFEDYGAFGMSDIARDIAREGYQNSFIDLAAGSSIPDDCALIAIAGAKDGFSRVELGRLDAYMKEGGRMLVFLGQNVEAGVGPLLPAWGMRALKPVFKDAPTLSGTDVIVSDFADHAVSAPLRGSRIVLERPTAFESSAAGKSTAERLEFTPLATVGNTAVAAAIERGAAAGKDVAIRPTRIVAIGDSGFPLNLSLSVKASANHDFILNAVAYLSGTDAIASGDSGFDRLMTGMDRAGRVRHLLWSAVVAPSVVFVALFLVAMRRRHRS